MDVDTLMGTGGAIRTLESVLGYMVLPHITTDITVITMVMITHTIHIMDGVIMVIPVTMVITAIVFMAMAIMGDITEDTAADIMVADMADIMAVADTMAAADTGAKASVISGGTPAVGASGNCAIWFISLLFFRAQAITSHNFMVVFKKKLRS